jgi:hypothetical protein
MGPGEILQKELKKELQVSQVVACHVFVYFISNYTLAAT